VPPGLRRRQESKPMLDERKRRQRQRKKGEDDVPDDLAHDVRLDVSRETGNPRLEENFHFLDGRRRRRRQPAFESFSMRLSPLDALGHRLDEGLESAAKTLDAGLVGVAEDRIESLESSGRDDGRGVGGASGSGRKVAFLEGLDDGAELAGGRRGERGLRELGSLEGKRSARRERAR
jgi:hypothetical protein